jgi:serine/threonine protein kinase
MQDSNSDDAIEFEEDESFFTSSSDSPTSSFSMSTFSQEEPFSPRHHLLNKRYEVKQTLGRGSYGLVSLVIDKKRDNAELALKQIACENDDGINRAMQEVWPIRFLQHEHLVQIKSVFVHSVRGPVTNSRFLCIVMKYFSGGDLDAMIKRRKQEGRRFDDQEIIFYMNQLLSAVEYLHSKRLIHRYDLICTC